MITDIKDIHTVQDLFDRWIEAEKTWIWDRSSDIQNELEELKIVAKSFADKHNLTFKETR